MNTALSWIKAYVPDLNSKDQEYTDAMTLTGTKVETYECLDENLDKIVVGQIDAIEKHPDADKLIVCQVNIGTEVIQIVTGASNVKEGDKVPIVCDGGMVAGGHDGEEKPKDGILIKAGKLRGVDSYGMMCSIEELGSTREMYPLAPENGIYIFSKDVEIGKSAMEILGLNDTVFEYEITSNRVDCYSVLGVAREAAATFKKTFSPPIIKVKETNENAEDYISVEVQDTDLCSRYCARVCKNIKIGPSPEWMQRRLAASGIRPINNLVDITNYVMEEYGQPMHAFDLKKIAGNKIIVKKAKDGELFTTLDEQERKLDKDMLMICDNEKAIAIAGIMGGENSKIDENIETIVFESACFNGANIRKSAKRLGIRTEASGKFEKGLDPNNALNAINRACQLIDELGCGEVTKGVIDVCIPLKEKQTIEFDSKRINALLGTDIDKETMLSIFERLELEYDSKSNKIIIPTFRQDLELTEDLAEEVARFYGYDNIPSTLPNGEATTGKLPFNLRVEAKARDIAEHFGFSQAMSYSFESKKVFEKLLLDENDPLRKAIEIENPLGEDFSIMRTISLDGMLTSLATNYNRRNKDVRLYELGNVYIPKSLPLIERPDERMKLTYGMYGEGDFFTMKAVIEEFFKSVGMNEIIIYNPEEKKKYLHPGRQADIIYLDEKIGYIGEIHPKVCEAYDIATKVYVAVLDMKTVVNYATFERKYIGIAKFPAVTRDISMVVPKNVLAGQIESVIRQRGGKILEGYELFDIYEGEQIEKGFKSIAYSIYFRHKEKTLEENEITKTMKKIINGLENLGIELRK